MEHIVISIQPIMRLMLRIMILLIFACLYFYSPVSAQWASLGDSIIPFKYQAQSLKIAPDRSIWVLATQQDRQSIGKPKVVRSTNEGANWDITSIDVPDSIRANDIAPIDSSSAFVALGTGLYKTINGGKEWAMVEPFPYKPLLVHFFNKNEGWVYSIEPHTPHSLFSFTIVQSVTIDGGNTWTHIGGENWDAPPGTSLPTRDSSEFAGYWFFVGSSYDYTENEIILGFSNGNYWLSEDRGFNWSRHTTPLAKNKTRISNVAMKDRNTYVIAGNFGVDSLNKNRGHDTRSYTTIDGGSTWFEGNPGVTAAAMHYIPGSDSTFIMVGHIDYNWGGGKGTAISYDYGKNWVIIDQARMSIVDFLDEGFGFATCGGLPRWRTTSGQVSKWDLTLPEVPESKVNWLPWIVIAVIFVFGAVFHKIRLSQAKKKASVEMEISELERAALQAQMNPHFIFNSLNSLQSYINHNEKESSNIFLSHFSRLIRGTLKASGLKEISLQSEIDLLKSYLELEKMRFNNRFDYKITVEDSIDPESITLPPMITQPLIENAVIHGMAGKSSGGMIELNYRVDAGNVLIITLKDNGVGLNHFQTKQTGGHKSTGLDNTKKRLKLLNYENKMDMSELQDESGNTSGTIIVQYIHLTL